jgi:DNA-binding transcriptional MerR regulator
MKRSGGRRYYRPDDVDLLRGIRRLLYGEGYTIRGVQRILKEHGIKAVQGLVDGSAAVPSFAAPGDPAMRGGAEADDEEVVVDAGDDEDETDAPVASRASVAAPSTAMPASRPASAARKLDLSRLEAVLQDLIACRQLLDGVMKEG